MDERSKWLRRRDALHRTLMARGEDGLQAYAKAERMVTEELGPFPPKPAQQRGAGLPLSWRLSIRLFGGKDMLDKVKKLWAWLDGKKTAIGALATFLTVVVPALAKLLGEFDVDPGVTTQLVSIGALVVGLLHKLLKHLNGK